MRSMLSKLIRCLENWNAYSQHWSAEKAQFFLSHNNARLHVIQPMLQKLNKFGYKVLLHLQYSPDVLPTNYHLFKYLNNFLQRKYFHNQQDAENAFQELVESQSTDFYATGINKLSSHWQKCVACTGSYFFFINKDVFEPTYNDLKFTVWNYNYLQ